MIKSDCLNFKEHKMWNSGLCGWCKERNCSERKYDWSLAGRRWTMKVGETKTKIVNGQYEWDWGV